MVGPSNCSSSRSLLFTGCLYSGTYSATYSGTRPVPTRHIQKMGDPAHSQCLDRHLDAMPAGRQAHRPLTRRLQPAFTPLYAEVPAGRPMLRKGLYPFVR